MLPGPSHASRLERLERRILLSALQLSPATNYPVGENPDGVAIADFTGDREPDLVVVNSYAGDGGSATLLINNGDGTFHPGQTLSVGLDPTAVAAGDLNGDGRMDLAVANGTGAVTVLLGNGNGTFQPPRIYPVQTNPDNSYEATALILTKLSGEGALDIVTADWTSSGGAISVLMNNGNGTFQPPKTFATGIQPDSLAAGVLTDSGNVDLAVADRNLGNDGLDSILLGNGNGTFQPQQTVAAGLSPEGIALGDLNGDGNLDLITVNSGGNDLSLALGNGNGAFGPPSTFGYSAASYPDSIAVADLTGDGKQDVIVGDAGTGSNGFVGVLLGNGNGTFQPQRNFLAEYDPTAISTADLNGDGLPDIVAADFSGFSDAVSVFLSGVASDPFTVFSNGLLTINGTANADTISVSDSDGSVMAYLNGQSNGPFSGVTGVSVLAGAGDDSVDLSGFAISSTVDGAGGNDTILGGAGNDSLRGGGGNDSIGGAGGDDTIVGGGGDDFLKGGAGNDELFGGPGDDTIHGGAGDDSIFGGVGDDCVNGNAGNDTIMAGSGSSILMAGPGMDSITGSTQVNFGADTIYCGGNADTIDAGADDLILDSSKGDHILGGQIV